MLNQHTEDMERSFVHQRPEPTTECPTSQVGVESQRVKRIVFYDVDNQASIGELFRAAADWIAMHDAYVEGCSVHSDDCYTFLTLYVDDHEPD